MKYRIAALSLCLVPLAGCATTPPPCTQEWVDYKSDRILRKFASENRGLINDLRRLTDSEGDLSPFATLRLASRGDDLERFADSFENVVIPELEAAYMECAASPNLIPALTGFLRDEGVSEEALQWVAPIMGLMQEMRDDIGNSQRNM